MVLRQNINNPNLLALRLPNLLTMTSTTTLNWMTTITRLRTFLKDNTTHLDGNPHLHIDNRLLQFHMSLTEIGWFTITFATTELN